MLSHMDGNPAFAHPTQLSLLQHTSKEGEMAALFFSPGTCAWHTVGNPQTPVEPIMVLYSCLGRTVLPAKAGCCVTLHLKNLNEGKCLPNR